MITNFKIFEKVIFPEDDFNIGDKVLCIDDLNKLDKNTIYEIEDIKKVQYFTQFKLYGVDYYWDYNHFKKCTPRQIKKYNFNKEINKYNL